MRRHKFSFGCAPKQKGILFRFNANTSKFNFIRFTINIKRHLILHIHNHRTSKERKMHSASLVIKEFSCIYDFARIFSIEGVAIYNLR